MAYMSQEKKAKIAPVVKAILKKYGIKGSLSVRNHSTLTLTVKQGPIDFISNFNETVLKNNPLRARPAEKSIDVNPYWYHEHFDGVAKEFLTEIFTAMKGPDYFDESDAMTDYFHCSHYYDVKIGRWDQPYALVK